MNECPSPSAHDYVVTRMDSGANLRCHYLVECSRCGDAVSGYADEIPPARFMSYVDTVEGEP